MKKSVINLVTLFTLTPLLLSCNEEEFFEKDYIETFTDQNEIPNSPIGLLPPSGQSQSTPELPVDTEAQINTNELDETNDQEDQEDQNTTGNLNEDNPNESAEAEESDADEQLTTPLIDIKDQFTQTATTQSKVDILWVIDNSGSMRDEQENLAVNFSAFINQFSELEIDFKMSITTTDTSNRNSGKPVSGSIDKLTSSKLKENKRKFISDFQRMVQVGTSGSGNEKGIKASEVFVKNYARANFRNDAFFAVIYLSDEEDQSEKSVKEYLNTISEWKTNPGLVKAFSIVDTISSPNNMMGITKGSKRYQEISKLTGGTISEIKNSFYSSLLDLGTEIVTLAKSFPLTQQPSDETHIIVKVEDTIVSQWTYDVQTRTVKFNDGFEPQKNQTISIEYQVES